MKININKVIVYLTLSDIFTWGLYLIINSFVGIYLAEKLDGAVLEFIGVGTAIYYIVKGSLQIPIGLIADRIKKDKDDIIFLLLGNVLMGLPFLFYPLIQSQYLYFLLQFVLGTGSAMNLVNWRKLFAKNLDKGKEGLEYGAYDAVMSLTMSFFSALAGFISNISETYFDIVMISIGLLMISGGFWAASIFTVENRKTKYS